MSSYIEVSHNKYIEKSVRLLEKIDNVCYLIYLNFTCYTIETHIGM